MLEEIKDPRTRKMVTFVSGKIEGVYFNELKTVKTYSGPNGPWTPTHNVSIVVDGTRVGFGLTDKEAINAKDVDGNYHKLDRGMEVSVEITEVGEYNGNPQYNSKASKVTVLDASSVAPAKESGGKQTYSKKDMSGVVAGNGFNAAKALLGTYEDVEDFIKTANSLVDIGQTIREKLKTLRPDLDEYSVGAQSGMALIAACEWVEDIEDVEDVAMDVLENVLPKITDYVKKLEKKSSPAVVKKTVVKKVDKKTTKKALVVEDESNVDDPDIPENAFEDDEVPF